MSASLANVVRLVPSFWVVQSSQASRLRMCPWERAMSANTIERLQTCQHVLAINADYLLYAAPIRLAVLVKGTQTPIERLQTRVDVCVRFCTDDARGRNRDRARHGRGDQETDAAAGLSHRAKPRRRDVAVATVDRSSREGPPPAIPRQHDRAVLQGNAVGGRLRRRVATR